MSTSVAPDLHGRILRRAARMVAARHPDLSPGDTDWMDLATREFLAADESYAAAGHGSGLGGRTCFASAWERFAACEYFVRDFDPAWWGR